MAHGHGVSYNEGRSGGWMDKIGGFLGGAAGSAFGGVGTALGAGVGNWMQGKIFGIPKPKTGTQIGQSGYEQDEARFPGTNPWERLGSNNPMAQIESTRLQTNQQRKQIQATERIAGAERENKMAIAELGARTSLQAAGVQRGLGRSGGSPDEKFAAEVSQLQTHTLQNLQKNLTEAKQTGIKTLELEFWKFLKAAGLTIGGVASALGVTKAYQIIMRGKSKVPGIPTPRRSPMPQTGRLGRSYQNIPKKGKKGKGDRDIRNYKPSRYRGKDSGEDYPRPDTRTMSGREYWKAVKKSRSTR